MRCREEPRAALEDGVRLGVPGPGQTARVRFNSPTHGFRTPTASLRQPKCNLLRGQWLQP